MKKYLLIGFAMLMLSARLPAQNGITGNLNAATTTCLVSNSCLILSVPHDVGGATIKLSGTWVGTVQFEVTADPLTVLPTAASWVSLSATPSSSVVTATSATANGTWQVNLSGYQRIRLRVSAYTSGTIAGAVNLSTASARGGSGGGGGGGGICSIAGGVFFETSPNVAGCDAALTWDNTNKVLDAQSSFVGLLANAPPVGIYQLSAVADDAGVLNVAGTTGILAAANVSAATAAASAMVANGSSTGAANLDEVSGVQSTADHGSAGTLTNLIGIEVENDNDTGSGAVANSESILILTPAFASATPVASHIGIEIQDQASSIDGPNPTSAIALLIASQTSPGKAIQVDGGTSSFKAVTATSFTSTADGVHSGQLSLVGNTANPSIPSNTFNLFGPTTATFTAYGLNVPSAAPAAGTVWCQNSITLISFCNQLTYNGITTSTTTDAWILANTTSSTALATIQNGPCLRWTGHGWNTSGTPADNQQDFRACMSVSSGAFPTPTITWGVTQNGGGFSTQYVMDGFGDFAAFNSVGTNRFQNTGGTFTASGCTNSTLVGGSSAGTYKSGTTGTCTVTVTMGGAATANNGWTCWASDSTTIADTQTCKGTSTTTIVISGTTLTNDIIQFGAMAY